MCVQDKCINCFHLEVEILYSLAFIASLWVFWEIWWTVLEVKCVTIRCGLHRARSVPEPLLSLALRSPKTTGLVRGQVTSDTILVSGPSAFNKQARQSRRQKHVYIYIFFFCNLTSGLFWKWIWRDGPMSRDAVPVVRAVATVQYLCYACQPTTLPDMLQETGEKSLCAYLRFC